MATRNVQRKSKRRYEFSHQCGKPSRRENVRLPGKARRMKRELHVMKAEAVGAWMIPMSAVWRSIGTLILLPLCVVTAMAFFACFGASMEASFWRSSTFWFFMLGMIMWLIVFFALERPVYLYVWGHEATHALFTYCCLGKVHEFRVTREGGHIVTDKNNLLIALSPYFVPLYALVLAFVFWLVGEYVDLTVRHPAPWSIFPHLSWQMLGYWALGAAWGFHFTFTVWMIVKDQPDLKANGTIFSLNVIVLANLLLLSLLLIQAAPTISWHDFGDQWMGAARRILHTATTALITLRKMLG